MLCRHCHQRNTCRPRGLCWCCFHHPEIRALYPRGSANPATAKYVPHECTLTDAELDALVAERLPTMPEYIERHRDYSPRVAGALRLRFVPRKWR